MKKIQLIPVLIALALLIMFVQCQKETDTETEQDTATQTIDIQTAMEKFHTVLRPLQHQAVPRKNVLIILNSAENLYSLALVIRESRIPENLQDEQAKIDSLRQDLVNATQALNSVPPDVTEEEIIERFSLIHDKYENLGDTIYKIENMME